MDTSAPAATALSAEQFSDALAKFTARLEKLEAFAFPPADPNKKEDPEACMSRKVDEAVKLALKDLAKTFSTPAAPASPASPTPPAAPEVKTFAAVVKAKTLELKGDKAAAIVAGIQSNPTEYAAYLAECGAGKLVLL